jgi:hypothetical protein
VSEVSVQATDAENADRSLETLGLAPDLSSLSREVLDLIRDGSRNGNLGGSEAAVAVCMEMLRAGYGAAEIWMIMTEPTYGISKLFFSIGATQAEDWLERIIREADAVVAQS